ncbi:MAG: S8 family serine peptidase, partial [Chthoniobacteraceae bacterium]
FLALLGSAAIFASAAFAQAIADINIEENGQARKLDLALDEVQIKRTGDLPAGLLKIRAEGVLPDAAVFEDRVSSVLVRLKKPLDRAMAAARGDIVSGSFPEAEVSPVLYEKGARRERPYRRIGTSEVQVLLTDGRTAESVQTLAGAKAMKRTRVTNLVILGFDNPYEALDRSQALQAQGVRATPVLARYANPLFAVPKDQFFNRQWHLVNTGQLGARVGIDINALAAWDVTLGNNTTIAVIDDCLETQHPDLKDNCPPIGSKLHHDFNDADDDPKPVVANGDFHGTSVSGLAAAAQNNGVPDINTGSLLGVSGVAPNARLLGLRLIAGPFTDQDTANALYWHPGNTQVSVCNNSWGFANGYPADLVSLGPLGKAALRDAATLGRDGKGQVVVFSAGNSRSEQSNANFFTTTNSRYVVTVGALNCFGTFSSYSTPGASLLICAPGGGFGTFGVEQRCTTTDVSGTAGLNPNSIPFDGGSDLPNLDYTNQMNGTSAAGPVATGVVALMLSANSDLGWRDVKEILAGTAIKVDEGSPGWVMRPALASPQRETNEANFKFNNDYGAGLVDAGAAVARSLTWANLGQELTQSVRVTPTGIGGLVPDNASVKTFSFNFSGQQNLRAEQIEIEVRIAHPSRGQLRIALVSPSGTRSVLAVPRSSVFSPPDFVPPPFYRADYVDTAITDNFQLQTGTGGWVLSTTRHWGENTQGTWQLEISDENPDSRVAPAYAYPGNPDGLVGRLIFGEIRLYGTASGQERVVFEQQRQSIVEPGAITNQDIIVRRLGPTTSAFTVDYSTTVGTATANVDYTPVTGTLTFNPGDVTQTIPVPIHPDSLPENTETVNVVLTNLLGTGVSFGGTTLTTIDIADDENQFVTVSAIDPRAAETVAALPSDGGTFLVARSKVTDQPLTVFLSAGGTGTPGNGAGDYETLPTQVTIPAFERAVAVPVRIYDDGLFEGNETITLAAVSDASYVIGNPGSDTVQIVDNDRPKIQIAILNNDRQAAENPLDTATFRITRDLVTPQSLFVFLRFGGTQTLPFNYKLTYSDVNGIMREVIDPLNSSVEIGANRASVDITLVPKDDAFYQATKSAIIGLQPNEAYDFSFGFLTEVAINISEDDPRLDSIIPSVAITAPKKNTRLEAPSDVAITGRAADNEAPDGLIRLSYRLNGGIWENLIVPGLPAQTVDWTATFLGAETGTGNNKLVLGLNTFEIRSVDKANNESKIAVLKFLYIQQRNLTTTISGLGSVSAGFAPASQRDAGSTVAVTAQPGNGQVFDKWVLTPAGGLPTEFLGRALTFTMPDVDATLTANFIASPFGPISGAYNGLVKANIFGFESAGFLKLNLGATGTFSGQLTFAGLTYRIKGEFSGSGRFQGQVERRRSSPLVLDLTVDTAPGGTHRITGTVNTPTTQSLVSADRAVYGPGAPAPGTLVKSYTIFFPQTLGAGLPQGTGWATMKIDAAGKVSWTGRLPDGTTAKQTVPLTKDGTWPLFINLYKKRGVILGQVTHADLAGSDLSSPLDWLRPADPRAPLYPFGFSINGLGLIGSVYLPPVAGARVLTTLNGASPNATVMIDQGNLLAPISEQVTVASDNKVAVAGGNQKQLSMRINTTTGALSGNFVHPVSAKRVNLSGVFFQKAGLGYGTFSGSSVKGAVLHTGTLTLTPIP